MLVVSLFAAIFGTVQAQACQRPAGLHQAASHAIHLQFVATADQATQHGSAAARSPGTTEPDASELGTQADRVTSAHRALLALAGARSNASAITVIEQASATPSVSAPFSARDTAGSVSSCETSPSSLSQAACFEGPCLCGLAILTASPAVAHVHSHSEPLGSSAARIVGPSTSFDEPPRSGVRA